MATSTKPPHPLNSVATDASFLERLNHDDAVTATAAASSSTANVVELHRSNLLRLQSETLAESTLRGCSSNKGWNKAILSCLEQVAQRLEQVGKNDDNELAVSDKDCLQTCPLSLEWSAFNATDSSNSSNPASVAQALAHKIKSSSKPWLHVAIHHHDVTPALLSASCSTTQLEQALLSSDHSPLDSTTSGNAHVLPTISLVVQFASYLWDPKDVSKHKYFVKRNLLVWHVARQLTRASGGASKKKKKHKSSFPFQVYWRNERNDARKPYLILVPTTSGTATTETTTKHKKQKKNHNQEHPTAPKFRIALRFQVQDLEWISSPLRLLPNRSNLPQQQPNSAINSNNNTLVGTPLYNHAILEDAQYHFIHSANSARQQTTNDDDGSDADASDDEDHDEHYPALMDTLALLNVWCLQRGLLRAHDGLTSSQIGAMLLYLYRTHQAKPRMHSLQVMAVWFQAWEKLWGADDDENNGGTANSIGIAKHVTDNSAAPTSKKHKGRSVWVMPLAGKTEAQTVAHCALAQRYRQQTLESPLTDDDPRTLIQLYRQQFPGPVLLDSSMRFNFLGRLSPSLVKLLHWHAARSLPCLHSGSAQRVEDPYLSLFLTPSRFWDGIWDFSLRIPLAELELQVGEEGHSRGDAGTMEYLLRRMDVVLRGALGDRIVGLRFLSTGNGVVSKYVDKISVTDDTDEIPTHLVAKRNKPSPETRLQSPVGSDQLVLGVKLNPDTCHRLVDRGPPSENAAGIQSFLDLWGKKAELRRFKDGAIVHAVVWNTTQHEGHDNLRYHNEDHLQGGIVERIVRYIVRRHFGKKLPNKSAPASYRTSVLSSPLRDMLSLVDGVAPHETSDVEPDPVAQAMFGNPTAAHRRIMKAFESLATFLRTHSLKTLPIPGSLEEKQSHLGTPLAIDAVEPLSPSLRYSELFPPLPHPFLCTNVVKGMKKASGTIVGQPILIQIRFGASSKWPTDLKAIGAAKTAMLIQLVNGIDAMKNNGSHDEECSHFQGPAVVTPRYVDLGYMGYVFRITVRADPELRLLRGLVNPSHEASSLLRALTRDHVAAAMHHSMIHSIHTAHPSSSGVLRMARRWVAGHVLSGLVPQQAIELLVAKIYSDQGSSLGIPGSVSAGFLRFLFLLESHDWLREPLIVDPHGHLSDEDRTAIRSQFEASRGPDYSNGPPMFVISPNDRQGFDEDTSDMSTAKGVSYKRASTTANWMPSFTAKLPEWVVLGRAVALARTTRAFLTQKEIHQTSPSWPAAFQETTSSFTKFDVLLRIDPDFVVDRTCSSSAGVDLLPLVISDSDNQLSEMRSAYSFSMRLRYLGPKVLRRKLYRNMRDDRDHASVLHDWRPVDAVVQALRQQFGSLAIFFYNALCPEIIGVLWRPDMFARRPFSVMNSEYASPCVLDEEWKSDTMVVRNVKDVLREMSAVYQDIVTQVKVQGSDEAGAPKKVSQPKRKASNDEFDSDLDSSASSY